MEDVPDVPVTYPDVRLLPARFGLNRAVASLVTPSLGVMRCSEDMLVVPDNVGRMTADIELGAGEGRPEGPALPTRARAGYGSV